MKHKPKRTVSIRTKMVIYLTLFTAISLIMLMLFQVLFLDVFYESQTMSTVKNAAEDIAAVVDTVEIKQELDYWNAKEQLNSYIIDSTGTVLKTSANADEAARMLLPYDVAKLYEKTSVEGEYVEKRHIVLSDIRHNNAPEKPKPSDPLGETPDKPARPAPQNSARTHDENDVVIYARMAGDKMILIVTLLTPVDATISTLYIQFVVAAIVLILFAVLIGWWVAGKIARPIDRINVAARGLSEGEYHSPGVTDYKEATELCETLDYVSVELKKNEQLQLDLIANVSHDLRTPLTMITGYSEAIRDLPGENSAENIQVVIDEAQRLTELVNDVLDLSKLQSGMQSLEMERIDLAEILSSSVERCQTLVSAEGYHIVLEGCEPAIIMGDAVRLFQIIYNLLGNALAYTGEDRTVRVTQIVSDGRVRVSVADSGKGIPEDELPFIWQRYYQSNRATNKRQPIGTGLGLSIVYNLVSLHQGECGVTSRVGEGSVFWFDIPLV